MVKPSLASSRPPKPEDENVGMMGFLDHLEELRARLIRSCMRDSDFAARYGDEEFVVVMPQTKLSGACVFGDRLRQAVIVQLATTLRCGASEYQDRDDLKSLLGRADSAFYSAKAAGGNRQFVHTGSQIREHRGTPTPAADAAKSPAASPMPPLVVPATQVDPLIPA